ncbi:cingulin-like [Halichondria panicea]|uniref:cingulin-like n=1 Tax=Halichondria panicea TaxID=6063 RepID=UPI00312BB236
MMSSTEVGAPTQEISNMESPEATTEENTEQSTAEANQQVEPEADTTQLTDGLSQEKNPTEPVDDQQPSPENVESEQQEGSPDQDIEQQNDDTLQQGTTTLTEGEAPTETTATDTQHEQGESQEVKEPIEAANETTEGEATIQPEIDNREALDEKEIETTEPETSSGEEPVKDKKEEPVATEIKQTNASRPGTDKSATDAEKDKKDKKKEKKREKKKSRQASRDNERKKLTSAPAIATNLESILLSHFLTSDLEISGHVDSAVFWEILQSPELNLQLGTEELSALNGLVQQDQSGLIDYAQFSSQATELIASLYQQQPASEEHWVQLTAKDGSATVSYNKQTGETRESAAEELDIFASTIENLFRSADVENRGYITRDEFAKLLQSEQMAVYLSHEDMLQMQQYFDNIPDGMATYTDFYPLGKEIILRLYRARDTSDSEWCQLDSTQGVVWFNKFTGETRKEPADDRQQEIAFLNQAYAQVEAVNFELEQYKQQNKELQNELAQAAEEQETLATQLYETGHHLDEAGAEIEAKDRELEEARAIIQSKEQDIEQIMRNMGEFEALQQKLEEMEHDMKMARQTVAVRDQTVADRDTNISELQRISEAITDKLKSAHGHMDARDSTIASLQHKLNFQKMEATKYSKQVVELEETLSVTEQELTSTKKNLEEKSAALTQARKHLKNSRERTMDLEKDSDKLTQTQEKFRSAECEIRTLKSFLTTKTAMIEKTKKELRETRAKVADLQEKDRRRAIILADVLEKTARQFQTGTSPTRLVQLDLTHTPMDTRPASAPALPQDQDGDETDGPVQSSNPRVLKSYTLGKSTASPFYGATRSSPPQKRASKAKPRGRSRTVPKLPPIPKTGLVQRPSSFVFPTQNDLRKQHFERDKQVYDHVPSNPQCTCELCQMNASVVGPNTQGRETGQSGLSGFQSDIDPREMIMARQLKTGQRVVIRMKKSEYDFEPQQLTGIVKYVGKIDSEYIDNRIYVGVKLDEAAGDTDGLIKGKRYFTCPQKHGKIVRISNVVAVLPNKSVSYKPLKGLTKRSPYGGAAPKKSTSSVKVV